MEKNEEFDKLTNQLLEILFGSFSIIMKRMLHDHLKSGMINHLIPYYWSLKVHQMKMSLQKEILGVLIILRENLMQMKLQ